LLHIIWSMLKLYVTKRLDIKEVSIFNFKQRHIEHILPVQIVLSSTSVVKVTLNDTLKIII